MARHRWYEKLFYHFQLKERRYFHIIFYFIILLFIVQIILIHPDVRKFLVLAERFEGEPVRFLKKF